MKVIATIPPYAPFLEKLAAHPVISGVRLNTIMPTRETPVELLKRLKSIFVGKDIWIDLKCRQIRTSYGFFFKAPEEVRHYNIGGKEVILDPSDPKAHGVLRTPPWAELKIDRKIKLDFSKGPIKCWFQDGTDSAYIVDIIDGDKLIMLDGPKRVVGGGESINIVHPSLEIEGYLTDKDIEYIKAGIEADVHTYMLSYVEKDSDIEDLLAIDDKAIIAAKIESAKGVKWARESYGAFTMRKLEGIRLMAARGDLYVEMGSARPEKILPPLASIACLDEEAILASRLLGSLKVSPRPSCSDITDIDCMLSYGYKTFMIGDDICFNEGSLMLALDIMEAIDDDRMAYLSEGD